MVIRETFSGEFTPSLKTRFHDVLLVKHAHANTLNGTENMTFEKRATPAAVFPLPLLPSGAKKSLKFCIQVLFICIMRNEKNMK